MTRRMEVLQVQCVIPHLINRCAVESHFSDLEFDYKYNGPNQQNGVDSTPHSWNVEFQEQRAVQANKMTPKKVNLS